MRVKFISGPNKLRIVKILIEELVIGLKEAKNAVNNDEFKCTKQSYEEIKKKIESNGGLILEHT